MNIRPAAEQDLSRLYELDHIARENSERRSFVRKAVTDARAWVAEAQNDVVGYGVLSHDFFGHSFIELIYFEETQRSRGYGPTMIGYIEQQSHTDDLFTSTNESNLHMQHVLEKLGYERSGVISNLDPGDPEVVYFKRSVRT